MHVSVGAQMPYLGAPWRMALLAVYVPSVLWVGALTFYTVFVRGGVGKNRSTVAVRYLPALRPPLQPSIIHSTPLHSTGTPVFSPHVHLLMRVHLYSLLCYCTRVFNMYRIVSSLTGIIIITTLLFYRLVP